jgi:thiamine-phosphate diphosphorylase
VFRSVHTESEAEAAARDGADAIVVGTIWPTATHPSQPPAGTALLERVVSFGVPTYAIGGVTPARVAEAKAAGAWGVAAITALWDAAAPYRVAMEMMKPWMEMG